jgi:hypothetical protein
MTTKNSNYCRFTKLTLRDYGVFNGINHIDFNADRNLILGNSGTGKTTIWKALACLGPSPDVEEHHHVLNPRMSVTVETIGNRDLLIKYRKIVFLSDAARYQDATFHELLTDDQYGSLEIEALDYFHQLLPDGQRLLNGRNLMEFQKYGAMNDQLFVHLSFVFAIRKILELNLPIVLESPYGPLDDMHSYALSKFLKNLRCQQILLVNEFELLISQEKEPAYRLDYSEGSVRVRLGMKEYSIYSILQSNI